MSEATLNAPDVEQVERAVVRFAGDSGDGMQLTGSQFTNTTASVGNDLATLPDFPAEIRAPAGTLAGVSGFQIQFAAESVFTPGDQPDVLVAMNPAALKANIGDLRANGILIVNADAFRPIDLKKANYEVNPLEDGSLDAFRVFEVPLTTLTRKALEEVDLRTQDKDRAKNLFALGMMYYLYRRPLDVTYGWIEGKFSKKPEVVKANQLALKAGFAYCEAQEIFQATYEVPKARLEPGTYRNISGSQALALGFVAATQQSGIPLFQGSYPITPASDLLHELSVYKNFGVTTFQAEDEIAAIGAAIGASFTGSLGITSTSGPGVALKGEFLSLAIMAELPLVLVDVQRAGPSTGLPTKTEQADLLMAVHGRFGESPCIVMAAATPADCFEVAYEACRLSIKPHDAGDLAVRWLRRERDRAVEAPRYRRAAGDPGRVPHGSRRLPALHARPEHAGAPLGQARDTGARVPGRRAREVGRVRQRLLRSAEPRAHGPHARRQGRPRRRRPSADRGAGAG